LPRSSDSGSPPPARPRHGSPAFTAEPNRNVTFSRRAFADTPNNRACSP
jgi:hypothetical protein